MATTDGLKCIKYELKFVGMYFNVTFECRVFQRLLRIGTHSVNPHKLPIHCTHCCQCTLYNAWKWSYSVQPNFLGFVWFLLFNKFTIFCTKYESQVVFFHILSQTGYGIGLVIRKPTKAYLVQVSSILSKEDVYMHQFISARRWHPSWISQFWGLIEHFELYIQQISIQHPSVPPNSLCAIH